ncbi:MAG: hypothetical protein RBR47_05705 [Bacteroidales bacterium]|jgi:tRNA A22 N-methylase|nr:hypothetical protein [Bacteroidales bacterium]NCU34745.1 hypothetical protein [Candidatus Falkowbacteria bacterium]MDD2632234.1 hypothetical protein [Bacteroidales bacterium]MDD3527340.1 hypothetical protein [Bacteroidales bacterium]MDY0334436.1 hypothetical protein [Bacteroidales bacterium]
MQNQRTNISCVAGLLLIFILAANHQAGFVWIAGVGALLLIMFIRNRTGEIAKTIDFIFTLISWFCTAITVTYLIYTST